MKWFIKCLKHYADFNGRANREEYWMYVLFYIVFSIAWGILTGIMVTALKGDPGSVIRISMFYYFLLILPGLAVSVRRLHDTGHSGWMILVGLIPVVGGIWMLVLLVTRGQESENKYGPNPNNSPETFNDRQKLQNAGVTFIVASLAIILGACLLHIFVLKTGGHILKDYSFFVRQLLMLSTGIYLYRSHSIREITGNTRKAMLLLLATYVFIGMESVYSGIKLDFHIHIILNSLIALSLIAFALLNLYASTRKDLIRIASIAVISVSILSLIKRIDLAIKHSGEISNVADLFSDINIIQFAAYIILVATFYPSAKKAPQEPR